MGCDLSHRRGLNAVPRAHDQQKDLGLRLELQRSRRVVCGPLMRRPGLNGALRRLAQRAVGSFQTAINHIVIRRPSGGIAASPSFARRRLTAPHSTAWLLLTTGLPSAASSSSIASIWVV